MALSTKDKEKLSKHLATLMASNILMERSEQNDSLIGVAIAMGAGKELNEALKIIKRNAEEAEK